LSRLPLQPWDRSFPDRSPGFDPLRAGIAGLGGACFPSLADLQGLLDAAERKLIAGTGHPLRLIRVGPTPGGPYEPRVFRSGELAVRADNWHDLFNVLVWCTFPGAKAALNACHVREMERESPGRRGRVRDALTQFDEDGVIVLCSKPELLELVYAFQWKELFWHRREDVLRHMRFFVFGHALYEKLLAPFVGVTGRAVMLMAPPALTAAPAQVQLSSADAALMERIGAGALASPRDLQPVPVLGIPGWYPAGAEEAFYANATYFRSGRRG
jgi:Protein of unknown function (DUF3025)